MPPHCDTRDGPAVTAARRAIDTRNVNFGLIWVPETTKNELKGAFERALSEKGQLRSARTSRRVVLRDCGAFAQGWRGGAVHRPEACRT
jgi:hypothetical protein